MADQLTERAFPNLPRTNRRICEIPDHPIMQLTRLRELLKPATNVDGVYLVPSIVVDRVDGQDVLVWRTSTVI